MPPRDGWTPRLPWILLSPLGGTAGFPAVPREDLAEIRQGPEGAGAVMLAFVSLLQPPVDVTATVIAAFCLGAAAWIDEPRQSGPRGAPVAI